MRPGIRKLITLLSVFLAVWIGLRYFLPLCLPFLLGAGLALAAEPMVSFFCRKLRFPRALGAGIGVSLTFIILALLVLTVFAILLRELGELAGVLPDLEDTARSGMALLSGWLLDLVRHLPAGIRPMADRMVTGLFSGGTAFLDRATDYFLGLASGILSAIPGSALSLGTAIIASFMISAKLPGIRQWLKTRFPKERFAPWLNTTKGIKAALLGYLKAQLKLSGVTLLIVTLGMVILRVPYAFLWAIVVSLVDAFPVLGTGTILLPWGLVSLLRGNTPQAIGILALYAVVSLTRTILEPRLVGSQLGLDPLVTLAALYGGYRIWGIGGMILAPMLAVVALKLAETKTINT